MPHTNLNSRKFPPAAGPKVPDSPDSPEETDGGRPPSAPLPLDGSIFPPPPRGKSSPWGHRETALSPEPGENSPGSAHPHKRPGRLPRFPRGPPRTPDGNPPLPAAESLPPPSISARSPFDFLHFGPAVTAAASLIWDYASPLSYPLPVSDSSTFFRLPCPINRASSTSAIRSPDSWAFME